MLFSPPALTSIHYTAHKSCMRPTPGLLQKGVNELGPHANSFRVRPLIRVIRKAFALKAFALKAFAQFQGLFSWVVVMLLLCAAGRPVVQRPRGFGGSRGTNLISLVVRSDVKQHDNLYTINRVPLNRKHNPAKMNFFQRQRCYLWLAYFFNSFRD